MNRHADIAFLALTIWREARGESPDAKLAVAWCIKNRVNRPSWWGSDILSVVFKKWQFSSLTDPKDPQLTTWPQSNDKSWIESLDVAEKALTWATGHPAPGADSYYDISIATPKWANDRNFVKQIGKLRFYNVDMDTEV